MATSPKSAAQVLAAALAGAALAVASLYGIAPAPVDCPVCEECDAPPAPPVEAPVAPAVEPSPAIVPQER